MCELLNGPIPNPLRPPSSTNRGSKSPPSKFQPTDWRFLKMSIERILGYIGWLWGDAMKNRTAFTKLPNESRSSTIFVVVEQPDHHCGDDTYLEDGFSIKCCLTALNSLRSLAPGCCRKITWCRQFKVMPRTLIELGLDYWNRHLGEKTECFWGGLRSLMWK